MSHFRTHHTMMSPSLITKCLFLACFHVLSRAQGTGEYSSRLTTTVQSTVTIVPIAYTATSFEYLPASPSPTCNTGAVSCPACDGEDISTDGETYKVYCDAALSSNLSTLQPSYVTPNQCLVICDGAVDCVGTTLASNGSCVLTIGSDYRLGNATGEIAFVQNSYVPSNSSSTVNSSAPNAPASKFFSSATIPITYPTGYFVNASATNAVTLPPPRPYYPNYTLPNATQPINASVPINNTCTLANPTCPACANQTLTDTHNVTYTILCGYSLDATLDYAFGEPLPAAYCMSRCDERNVTCLGASWSTEECTLALGPYVEVEDPDHMAFIRARAAVPPAGSPAPYPVPLSTASLPRPPISTGLSYSNMSRYDGGSATRATISPTAPIVSPTVTATGPAISTSTPTDSSSYVSTEISAPTSTIAVTAAPSQGPPPPYGSTAHWGGPPPWAHDHGDYGVDEGSRHHPPQGSWWQGGRPPWSHWGGWGKASPGGRKQGR